MFCSNCGKQISEGSKFCNFCGATQNIIIPNVAPSQSSTQPTYQPQPTQPMQPTYQAQPMQPTYQAQPTQPMQPTYQAQPTQPMQSPYQPQPTQPIQPTYQTQPTGPVQPVYQVSPQRGSAKEGQVHKCPACGEILAFDALVCPACGEEIRGKKSVESVAEFVNRVYAEPNEEKRIELIKLYPIPNDREAIFEFMVVAASKFEPAFYASNPNANSISKAWLSQIELCYKKGKMLFTDPNDITRLQQIYNGVHGKDGTLYKEKKKRKLFLLFAIATMTIGTILILIGCAYDMVNRPRTEISGQTTEIESIDLENPSDLSYNSSSYSSSSQMSPLTTVLMTGGMFFVACGILTIIFGLKKKRTSGEIEMANAQRREAIERKDRLRREEIERRNRR